MEFSFAGQPELDGYRWFARGLKDVMQDEGHDWVDDPNEASLVVNFFPKGEPRPFRRRGQAVFLVSVSEVDPPFDDHMPQGYPLLVRSLSNLFIALVDGDAADPDAHFVTPEQGHYMVDGNCDRGEYFRTVYRRIHPLASSRMVIDNVFDPDLPEELRAGDEVTESIHRAGKRLGQLDLLPAPFPMNEILPERDVRHLKKLYGIGGLSYGNVSARKDEERFWMSASGVDKSRLREVGRDVLLVRGYDPDRNAMVLGVPPGVEPRRVSVDAIEHWTLYREHPAVGAVVHVHAWMDGVPVTDFNYPCGTRELAEAVAAKVREAPDPSRAVVGLKNHGLTITGRTLEGIFERIEDRIVPHVPME